MVAEDAIRAFEDAVRKRGIIPPPGGIVADGKIKRCAVEGTPHKKDGSILLFDDHPISGGFQNYRDGKGWENWTSGNSSGNGLSVECHDIVDRFSCHDIVDTRLLSVTNNRIPRTGFCWRTASVSDL
jgi:hypothetical protein